MYAYMYVCMYVYMYVKNIFRRLPEKTQKVGFLYILIANAKRIRIIGCVASFLFFRRWCLTMLIQCMF